MICDLENILELNRNIKNEKLDICVVSYGGCSSNTLVNVLERNGYICRTPIYDKILCHCPYYINIDIPVIYIYDNPIKSILSMKRRYKGWWDTNQKKMANNSDVKLSDKNLLELMIRQFNSWIKNKNDNILILKTSELFDNNSIEKIQHFLTKHNLLKNKNLEGFPIQYKKPNIILENIKLSKGLEDFFIKYKEEIDKINNYTT